MEVDEVDKVLYIYPIKRILPKSFIWRLSKSPLILPVSTQYPLTACVSTGIKYICWNIALSISADIHVIVILSSSKSVYIYTYQIVSPQQKILKNRNSLSFRVKQISQEKVINPKSPFVIYQAQCRLFSTYISWKRCYCLLNIVWLHSRPSGDYETVSVLRINHFCLDNMKL